MSECHDNTCGDDKDGRALAYARDLYAPWGVGDARCENGVVLFFAIDDRAMAISIGSGLTTIFPDKYVPVVFQKIRSRMQAEQFGQAIT